MKYSTAKRFVKAYKDSAAQRGIIIDRSKLKDALSSFKQGLIHNNLIGKY